MFEKYLNKPKKTNKYINYKNRKLIEDLQLKSTILVMEHFQINQHFGRTLTSTLERESTLNELNKTKNSLNVNHDFHICVQPV